MYDYFEFAAGLGRIGGDFRPLRRMPNGCLPGPSRAMVFDPTKSHNIPPDPVRALLWLTPPPGPTSLRSLGEQLASAV